MEDLWKHHTREVGRLPRLRYRTPVTCSVLYDKQWCWEISAWILVSVDGMPEGRMWGLPRCRLLLGLSEAG